MNLTRDEAAERAAHLAVQGYDVTQDVTTGDEVFRAKSKQRVLDLVRSAKAIVLVTHDMSWVTEFCNRAMLLEKLGAS